MDSNIPLAVRFEENRDHLRAVAYRMLGSASEAEDAVQEAWLRLTRAGASEVENLGGWLTTVVARVCLDMLRSRKSRREESLTSDEPKAIPAARNPSDPEREAQLAESLGLALLVVLETLAPAERLAFVLHDMFAVPFEEIGAMVGRTPAAARQLASRARRRVRGASTRSRDELNRQREVIEAFLAALRGGDFEGLIAVLDPDFVIRADATVTRTGAPSEERGARTWASRALAFSKGIRFAQPALVNGEVGVVLAPRGRLLRVLVFKLKDGKIAEVDLVGDPTTLEEMQIAVLS